MAIGNIRPVAPTQALSRSQANPNAFGAGVATAIGALAGAVQDSEQTKFMMGEALLRRGERTQSFDVQERFIRYQSELAQEQAERLRNSEAGSAGVTNLTEAQVAERNAAFLQTLPEALRPEYNVRLAQTMEEQVLQSFNFEYEQTNERFRQGVGVSLNQTLSEMRAGTIGMDVAAPRIQDLISASDLPAIEKEALYRSASAVIAQVEFTNEARIAAESMAAVGPGDGSDVSMAGALPQERAVLNVIAGLESGGRYDVRFGGPSGPQTFTDFSRHPGIFEETANGRRSSAAGRYQFTKTTWDTAVAQFNSRNPGAPVTDFSPVSQDRIAVFWARKRFNELSSDDFDQAVLSGDPTRIANIRRVLGAVGMERYAEWEGFRNITDEEFVEQVTADVAGGGTGSASAPNIWTDPRFESIPFDTKVELASAATREAAAASTALAAQMEAARQAALADINFRALDGNFTVDQIAGAREQGIIKTAEDELEVRTRIGQSSERETGMATVSAHLGMGRSLNMNTDAAGFDAYVGPSGRTAIMAGDQSYLAGFINTASTAGFIPPETQATFQSMLNSANTQQRLTALQALGTLQSGSDGILRASGFSAEDIADINYFRQNARFFEQSTTGQGQLLEQMRVQEENGTSIEEVRTVALEAYGETFSSPDALVNKIWDGILTSQPDLPRDGATSRELTADAQAAYIQGYASTNNPERAQAYMEAWMAENWGPTSVGGQNSIAKHPVENTYAHMMLSGSLDWMDQQVRSDFDLPPDATFTLIARPETVQDIQSQVSNPRYGVMVEYSDGTVALMPDHYQGEHTPDLIAAQERLAQAVQLGETQSSLEDELRAAQTRLDALPLVERTGGAVAPGEVEAAQGEVRRLEAELSTAQGSLEEVADVQSRSTTAPQLTALMPELSRLLGADNEAYAGIVQISENIDTMPAEEMANAYLAAITALRQTTGNVAARGRLTLALRSLAMELR
tara:strand:- start:15313 stop:18228 length:2916 start_codon:yes stop_codon:yes gene_type:complete